MSSPFSAVKTLIVPALVSLIIFLLFTFVLIPLWQRYRERYRQYLPLETISHQTSSLRSRIQGGFARFLVPSTWRQRLQDRLVVLGGDTASDAGFDSDEGEELGDVDDARRTTHTLDEGGTGVDSSRRLSRDLEEGFMDDSDEESDTQGRR